MFPLYNLRKKRGENHSFSFNKDQLIVLAKSFVGTLNFSIPILIQGRCTICIFSNKSLTSIVIIDALSICQVPWVISGIRKGLGPGLMMAALDQKLQLQINFYMVQKITKKRILVVDIRSQYRWVIRRDLRRDH